MGRKWTFNPERVIRKTKYDKFLLLNFTFQYRDIDITVEN